MKIFLKTILYIQSHIYASEFNKYTTGPPHPKDNQKPQYKYKLFSEFNPFMEIGSTSCKYLPFQNLT